MKPNNYNVVSQCRESIEPTKRLQAESICLPDLVKAWYCVEQATGYRWKSTSYWRSSPNHQHGTALDIAPDIAPSSAAHYSRSRNSDPVLYKREVLLRKLQALCRTAPSLGHDVGLFVEPDHIHIQLFPHGELPSRWRLIKWGGPKFCYADTQRRSKMALITH